MLEILTSSPGSAVERANHLVREAIPAVIVVLVTGVLLLTAYVPSPPVPLMKAVISVPTTTPVPLMTSPTVKPVPVIAPLMVRMP